MKLVPLNKHVIVKSLDPKGDQMVGKLIILESAREASHQAKVVSSDFDKVVAGDIIIYSKYSGAEFKLDGEDLIVLDDVDILAKIEV